MNKKSLAGLMLLALLLGGQTSWGADPEVLGGDRVAGEEVKGTGDESTSPAVIGGAGNGSSQPVTQEDLEGVRTEIETLREQWQRTYDRKTANTTRPLLFSGIVQTRYIATEDKAASTGAGGFDISAIILNFAGNLRRDYDEGKNVNYLFSLVTPSGLNDFTVKPLEASISYSILPSLLLDQPYLSVIVGQTKKPFGLEALATEDKKPTIRSAQATTLLGLDPRDIGVYLKGDLLPHVDYGFNYRVPLIEYSAGIFNGSGPNTFDNNTDKDIAARVILNAAVDYNSPWRGLSLGLSYYSGRQKVSLSTPAAGTTPAATYATNGTKDRFGADLSYVNTPVGFTLEYVRGNDVALSGTATSPVKKIIESEGYTFTLFYNFGEQFVKNYKAQDRYDDWYPLTYQPFFRFDRFDPNIHNGGDRTDIYTLGFNWFFAETTKLQLNANLKKEQTHEKANNELLALFQFGF
jgi:hypothetical protein